MKRYLQTPATSPMFVVAVFIAITPIVVTAQSKPDPKKPSTASYDSSVPKPTLVGIRYGDHERHILDFWKAESAKPTPLVFVIHGGGWQGGSKERLHRFVDPKALLAEGISVAAINYRYVKQAVEEGNEPPVFLSYSSRPAIGQEQKDPTHTANFGIKLLDRCNAMGVLCELFYPYAPYVTHTTTTGYLIKSLKSARQK